MAKKHLRDIVILLPGILGSVLQKDGKDAWALSGQAVLQGLANLSSPPLHYLFLDGDDTDDLEDGIRASRLVNDAHLIPGLCKIDGYSKLSRLITDYFLVNRGCIDSGQPANFFEFPYDWRRDNRVAARQLKRLVDRQLPLWRQYSHEQEAKVILLAHSMGGLVARYYLEVLEGWKDCRALITFGTPYRGSFNALNFLANGYKKSFLDLTKIMQSFTSVYQLLPIYKAVSIEGTDKRVAEINGIPGVVQARAERALAFHREIENAVANHQRDVDYREKGYALLPIVGTRQPTTQSAKLVNGHLIVSRKLPQGIDEWFGDGDGTVPRISAVPIELSEGYRDTFVCERHSSLQSNDEVLNYLRRRLEQMQATPGTGKFRGPETHPEIEDSPAISIDLDDCYITGELVEIHAHLVNTDQSAVSLEAHIEAIDEKKPITIRKFFDKEGKNRWVLKIEGLSNGLYRLVVRASKAELGTPLPTPSPVHDLFAVVY